MSALPRPRPAAPWRALVALFCVALIWGGTFVWMKVALVTAMERLGPGSELSASALFLALRFGVASLIVLLISRTARAALRRGSRAAWSAGLWLGFLLLVGFALQMRGLADVTPAVSAFLTSLYVLFTAVMSGARNRTGLSASLMIGAVMATLGAGLVRGRPELRFTTGEWLTVASALVFAVHILATDRLTRVVAPMMVTITSFIVVAAGNAALLGICASADDGPTWSAMVSVLGERDFVVPLVMTTVLATVIALSLMNLYQRDVDPVRAAILYAFEPIFAMIFALAAGLDELTPWLWVGGAMILLGNLVAEIQTWRNSVAEPRPSGPVP
jgi:drug/metabolite transporter (DMT)-like permease